MVSVKCRNRAGTKQVLSEQKHDGNPYDHFNGYLLRLQEAGARGGSQDGKPCSSLGFAVDFPVVPGQSLPVPGLQFSQVRK